MFYFSIKDQKELGIVFPENSRILYYTEGIPWLEQNAKLIIEVDQKDLLQLTDLFNLNMDTSALNDRFWKMQYLFNKKTERYAYSKTGGPGATTADILVVLGANNKAKLYMDIIYW